MHRSLSVLLCLSLALAGCKAKELADKASIAEDLKDRGTGDLMKEVANDTYDPPQDGRITDNQVQMYLKVREHEKKIAEVAKAEMKQHAEKAEAKGDKSIGGFMEGMKALGSAADFLTADIRAAKREGRRPCNPARTSSGLSSPPGRGSTSRSWSASSRPTAPTTT